VSIIFYHKDIYVLEKEYGLARKPFQPKVSRVESAPEHDAAHLQPDAANPPPSRENSSPLETLFFSASIQLERRSHSLHSSPAGVFDFLWNYAGDLVPSADLVTKFLSVWTEEDRESHERAAARIAEIAGHAMARVAECARSETPLSEYALSEWIRNAFDRDGLVTTSGPTVSLGANSARNHYEPRIENSAVLVPGQLLLVDLWAKEPGGIYADQTWMATIGPPSERDAWLWTVVRSARDAALALLKDRVDRRVAVTGAVVDIAARRVISEAGLGAHVAGRTGHSIDRFGLHGFGPPIDGTETHDDRLLLPGVGFSIEPGVYVKGQTGLRSEVNVYLTEDRVVVTPHTVQNELIVL
jgi:Xaa-Pro dipeptidase